MGTYMEPILGGFLSIESGEVRFSLTRKWNWLLIILMKLMWLEMEDLGLFIEEFLEMELWLLLWWSIEMGSRGNVLSEWRSIAIIDSSLFISLLTELVLSIHLQCQPSCYWNIGIGSCDCVECFCSVGFGCLWLRLIVCL